MSTADTLFFGGAPKNPAAKTADRDFPSDIPRDRWRRPLIRPADGKGGTLAYTRASTLGGTLEDQFNLGQWRMRQVAIGMSLRPDLQLAAKSIRDRNSSEGKRELDSICQRALEAAESDAKATIGTALHAIADRYDLGEALPDLGEFQGTLDAYAGVADDFTMHQIEQFVVCDDLQAAGTFDRLVSPKGTLIAPDGMRFTPDDKIVWDLKTSSTAQFFGIKFAVQLAVYAYGVPYSHERGRMLWETAPSSRWGLICHAASGGNEAALHWVDLHLGWQLAVLACTVRGWRKRKDLVIPHRVDEEPGNSAAAQEYDPVVRIASMTGVALQIVAELRNAMSREQMLAIRAKAREKGLWREDMDNVARARLAQLA